MLYSKLFGKTKKTVNQQFESKNHELLTKGGFIDQVSSGIYSLLPLGKKVLSHIENVIRQEMEAIGGQEISMPLLQPKINWQKTNRWSTVDILFKTKSQYGQEYVIAPTHEEIVTPLAKKYIESYRDLPLYLYHITPKFRDEPRPKSGILRGKEFGMKDLYSFHADKKDFEIFYQKVIEAYLKIFNRVGLKEIKITEASGGSFSKKLSHEFNVITPAGEVDLFYCSFCSFAQNQEIATLKEGELCPRCRKGRMIKGKAIEVGNIFDLNTRFSDSFDLFCVDNQGEKKPVYMGCYGIGTTRLLGAIVEVYHDDKGIIWPENIAPYQVHLLGLDQQDKIVNQNCQKVYQQLIKKKIAVLFDDRQEISAGQKFSDADLIGIPHRLVVSKRTGEKIEYKRRDQKESKLLTLEEIIKLCHQG
ncbi:MAG: His/Gly/Thr/Pro-type tRNA ligase C-terminal domain-containing protein [Microgenomates group bacterium]|nr:His/Gly/Thr/Pro-type tRNA ligase C-terminal domain-containing protein [Microgenomates group bacterium]